MVMTVWIRRRPRCGWSWRKDSGQVLDDSKQHEKLRSLNSGLSPERAWTFEHVSKLQLSSEVIQFLLLRGFLWSLHFDSSTFLSPYYAVVSTSRPTASPSCAAPLCLIDCTFRSLFLPVTTLAGKRTIRIIYRLFCWKLETVTAVFCGCFKAE